MIEDTRKINSPLLILLIAMTFAWLFHQDCAGAADIKDQAAVTLAVESQQAMGGMEGWKSVKAIRFDFRVEREGAEPRSVKHLWDREHGRDHVEGLKDGKPMVAWVDLTTRAGAAWLDGKKLEGDVLKQAMDWAFARWVNDTYWLIMPFKWLDNGVNLKKEPDRDGFQVLHLSFNQVGLTPGDQYWIFLNPKSHLMERWEFLLQDEKEKAMFAWKEWGECGPVKLSKLKVSQDGKVRIRFEPVQVAGSADSAYFSQQLKTLP